MGKIKIFGFMQYSILQDNTSRKSWAITKKLSFKEMENVLFDPDRLGLREKLLSGIALPSLKANMRDWADFRVVVVTSDRLPKKHMANLENICSAYEFVEIISVNTDAYAFLHAVNEYIDREVEEEDVYYSFRIDDDDAICQDFSDLVRPYINENYVGVGLSLPLGFSGFYDIKKKEIVHWGSTYVPMTAIGLGLVSKKGYKHRHIYDLGGSHRSIDRVVPVLLLSTTHAYFRTLHDYASMYYGKSTRARNHRTLEKIQKPASQDDITERIVLDKSLFAAKNHKIKSPNAGIPGILRCMLSCMYRCLKGAHEDR